MSEAITVTLGYESAVLTLRSLELSARANGQGTRQHAILMAQADELRGRIVASRRAAFSAPAPPPPVPVEQLASVKQAGYRSQSQVG